MNPILKYPGAKWRIAEWIIGHMPPHMGYVEPFFGSGAVFFNKEPSRLEIINDLNGEIVRYFRVMRDKPLELIQAVSLTPWARGELEYCRTAPPVADDVEMARRFLVRYWQSIGSGACNTTGWKHRTAVEGGSCARMWNGIPARLKEASERLLGAQIENKPALEVISHYDHPDMLIYADPPYVKKTRTANIAYEQEMTDKDHEDLLAALNAYSGMVLLSGYDNELYRDLLGDWHLVTKDVMAERAARRTECLWINPHAQERRGMLGWEGMA